MTEFKVTQKLEARKLELTFEGSIDEDTEFPAIDPSTVDQIQIDLNGIRAINSVGIREWLDWVRGLGSKVQLVLARCPKSMVFQFNMVDGFLPANAQVTSFYVPYFCEKCNFEGSNLFVVGREAQVAQKNVKIAFDAKASANCTKKDCAVEMDVSEAKYFQFLKRV